MVAEAVFVPTHIFLDPAMAGRAETTPERQSRFQAYIASGGSGGRAGQPPTPPSTIILPNAPHRITVVPRSGMTDGQTMITELDRQVQEYHVWMHNVDECMREVVNFVHHSYAEHSNTLGRVTAIETKQTTDEVNHQANAGRWRRASQTTSP